MVTKDDDVIEVCREETMNEILDRYMELNEHAASYTWKRLGRPLDMDKTLEDRMEEMGFCSAGELCTILYPRPGPELSACCSAEVALRSCALFDECGE